MSLSTGDVYCVLLMCASSFVTVLSQCFLVSDEVIRIRDVKDFKFSFWLLCIICVAYYVAVFPFIGLGL